MVDNQDKQSIRTKREADMRTVRSGSFSLFRNSSLMLLLFLLGCGDDVGAPGDADLDTSLDGGEDAANRDSAVGEGDTGADHADTSSLDSSSADSSDMDATDSDTPDSDAPDSDAGVPDADEDGGAPTLKNNFGHYVATRYGDTPADAAALCETPGVSGVVWRRTWNEVEPAEGTYDFSSFDEVLDAIADSSAPDCQLWLFVEFKSFPASRELNPCPEYLQADYSAENANARGSERGSTCFMWEPPVREAYNRMLSALGERFETNPRIEGVILQESALGFSGAFSQDPPMGTYTPEAWRDSLIDIITHCTDAFPTSHCMAFLNFIRGNQSYLNDISSAMQMVPNDRACFSGPDILPDEESLYRTVNHVYEVLVRYPGCRANSAQNDSYDVPDCDLDCIFDFAVSGTFGDFDETSPRDSGVCVNSYMFWNNRVAVSSTGLSWPDAAPVILANPYGPGWTDRCTDL